MEGRSKYNNKNWMKMHALHTCCEWNDRVPCCAPERRAELSFNATVARSLPSPGRVDVTFARFHEYCGLFHSLLLWFITSYCKRRSNQCRTLIAVDVFAIGVVTQHQSQIVCAGVLTYGTTTSNCTRTLYLKWQICCWGRVLYLSAGEHTTCHRRFGSFNFELKFIGHTIWHSLTHRARVPHKLVSAKTVVAHDQHTKCRTDLNTKPSSGLRYFTAFSLVSSIIFNEQRFAIRRDQMMTKNGAKIGTKTETI